MFGRLAAAATPADATAELEAIAGSLSRQFPATNEGVRFLADPINYRLLGGAATVRGWLPFITAGLIVLAVASTNAANLLLVGAAGRAREVAVRTALGASRLRIARQLLVESLLMAGLAAAIGLALSRAGVGLYRQWIPDGILPYWFDYSLNPSLVVALAALALVTAVVFAVLPALHGSRTTVVDVLKDGGRADTGRRATRVGGSAFLGLQLGLAIVLVAQVGISTLTSNQRLPSDARLDDPRVLTGTVTLPAARYATPDARRQFATLLLERVRALPGVVDVALASHGPVGGTFERRLTIEGRPVDGAPADSTVPVVEVSPGYFATLDVGRVLGRDFGLASDVEDETAVLVNERFATLHFPGEDPLGQRLALAGPADQGPPQWRHVVGVVPDLRQRPSQAGAVPIVYAPLLAASPVNATLYVRGTVRRRRADWRRQGIAAATRQPRAPRPRALPDARDPRRDVGLARVGHARQHRLPVGVRPGGGRALRRGLAPHDAPAARDRPAHGARCRGPSYRDAGDRHGGRSGGARARPRAARRRRLGSDVRAGRPRRTRGESRPPGCGGCGPPRHGARRLCRPRGPSGPHPTGRSAAARVSETA